MHRTGDCFSAETKAVFSVNQPLRLFDTCANFVSTHLDIVESLVNFPDLVGEIIFSKAFQRGQFKHQELHSSVFRRLKLFCDAYENLILSHLSLPAGYLFLNDHFDALCAFKHLKQLDVSYCGLGDGHELFQHISTLNRLQSLNMAGNSVSDAGVRHLTAPCRVVRSGPLQLQHLDLSDNLVTSSCLKFLSVFKHLQLLRLQSDIQEARDFESFLKDHGWEEGTDSATSLEEFHFETRGWAKCVLEDWRESTESRNSVSKPPGNSFYKRRQGTEKPRVWCSTPSGRSLLLCRRQAADGCQTAQSTLRPAVKRHLPSEMSATVGLLTPAQSQGSKRSRNEVLSPRVAGIDASAASPKPSGTAVSGGRQRHWGQARALKSDSISKPDCQSKSDEDLLAMYGVTSKTSDRESLLHALNSCWE